MPWERFLECLCEQQYSSLIIAGTAPEEELADTWVQLLSEYYELRGDMDGLEQWRLSRDITRLQNHLYLVDIIVAQLQRAWSPSLASSLNNLGYFFFPAEQVPERYVEELTAAVNQSKTKYIELKQLMKEQEKRLAGVQDKKPERQYYDSLLIAIEEMQGVTYNTEELMTAKFIQLEKKYWERIKQGEAQAQKINGKY